LEEENDSILEGAMYKSTVGIFISNMLMIWIIVLNNVGPGWEVPYQTVIQLSVVSFLLIVSMFFSIAMLILFFKQLKIRNLFFKMMYFIDLFICISALIFLFWIDGFHGQFWIENFPKEMFLSTALGINAILFILVSVGRFKRIGNRK